MDDKELEEKVQTEETGAENVTLEDLNKKIESLTKSLNYERSKRKEAEKRFNDDSKEIEAEKERIKAQLKSGKSGLDDDVINDIMNSLGNSVAEINVKQGKNNLDKQIMELMRDNEYSDAEQYADDIKDFIKKGLTVEQAYWAVVGKEKVSSSTSKAVKEHDEDMKKELNKERAKEGYVNTTSTNEGKREAYSALERTVADKTGKSVEEAKSRMKAVQTLEDILALNKKFKKGE